MQHDDLRLSNMVIDHHNNANIFDTNRRGYPVSWELPQITESIASKQRTSMYIGARTDIYQLGMML